MLIFLSPWHPVCSNDDYDQTPESALLELSYLSMHFPRESRYRKDLSDHSDTRVQTQLRPNSLCLGKARAFLPCGGNSCGNPKQHDLPSRSIRRLLFPHQGYEPAFPGKSRFPTHPEKEQGQLGSDTLHISRKNLTVTSTMDSIYQPANPACLNLYQRNHHSAHTG